MSLDAVYIHTTYTVKKCTLANRNFLCAKEIVIYSNAGKIKYFNVSPKHPLQWTWT